MKSLVLKYRFESLIILLVLLTLWPLTFHIYIPKWDNLDAYLPYRHGVGEMIVQGEWHLWSPFHYLGYPPYSDLQSGAWNPIVWLLTFIYGAYDLNALVTELLLCYIVAGIGMFRLARTLFTNDKIAFILGISYALSGFMVNSSQLMVFILGVAYLPWVCLWLYKLLNTFKWKFVILLAITIALHTTSASPAYTILLTYFCVATVIYVFIRKRKSHYNYKKAIIQLVISLFLVVLLILPYLNAFFEFAPYFNRIEEMPLEQFLVNPFTPNEYISFIYPFSTVSSDDLFINSSRTLRNGYFGIVGLTLLMIAIIRLRTSRILTLLIGIFLSLYLAWGYNNGIYEYLVHLPGIGTFRHPSIYRTFTIFFALLAAGYALKHIVDSKIVYITLKRSMIYWSIFAGITLFISFFFTSWEMIFSALEGVVNFVESPEQSIGTFIFINGLVLIIGILLAFALRKFFKVSLLVSLIVFSVFDLVINTQLSGPSTIYNTSSYRELEEYFDNLPEEINQSHNETPMKELDHRKGVPAVSGIWVNLSIYNKQLAYNGINPLRFKNYDEAENNGDLDFVVQEPLFFVPSRLRKEHDTIQSGLIWGIDKPYSVSEINKMQINNSIISNNAFSVFIDNSSDQTQYLGLNQNYHHLWQAKLNGENLEVNKINSMVMGVKIPPNSSGEVAFKFVSPRTTWTALIAFISYLISIGLLIFWYWTTPKSSVSSSHKE
ncbi:MAG: hypothetical protein WED10_08455 [Brumimicrobium sp.]